MEMWLILIIIYALQGKTCQQSVSLQPSTASVLEYTNLTLTCSYTGLGYITISYWKVNGKNSFVARNGTACVGLKPFNDPTLFRLNCSLINTFAVTLLSVAKQNHSDVWTCGNRQFIYDSSVTINVTIPLGGVILRQSGNRTIYENSSTEFSCSTTYGLPPAVISWYRSNGSATLAIVNSTDMYVNIKRDYYSRDHNLVSTEDTLYYRVNRSVHGWRVYCNATNWKTDSVMSNKILLNITYPPNRPPVIHDFKNGSTYKVIESKLASLSCLVEGGNPLGKPKWLCKNIINIVSKEIITDNVNVTTNISWIATRYHGETCICQSDHLLSTEFVFVNIDVLHPPEVPSIQLQFQNVKKNVTGVAKLIENKTYSLYCIADGNPLPSQYYWNGPRNRTKSNNGTLDFQNLHRKQNGTHSCYATNIMRPTYGGDYTGENNISVEVDVLYKPAIAVLNNQNVAEGVSLNVTCEAVSANPNKTNIIWTRDKHDWNIMSQVLVLRNVSRHDSMNYTCTLKNNMIPTVGPLEEGTASETLYLNVWYRASVKTFLINGQENENPTVANESSSITIICEIDSNPNSTVRITLANGTELSYVDTNLIEYRHFLSSCHDNGVYTCSGSNNYNKGQSGSANLSVLVNCKPMVYSYIDEDIRSELYVPATLRFTAIAYPEPEFTWEMMTNLSWTRITNRSMFNISSSGMQSNLTVNNFTSIEASHFRLIIENFVGKIIQNYTLQPYEVPGRLEVNGAPVVGIVIGCVVAVLVITIATVFTILIYRRYLKKKNERKGFVGSIEEVSEMKTIADKETACKNKKVYEEIKPEKDRGITERMENTYETLRPNKGRNTSEKKENDFKERNANTDDLESDSPVYTNLTLQCS